MKATNQNINIKSYILFCICYNCIGRGGDVMSKIHYAVLVGILIIATSIGGYLFVKGTVRREIKIKSIETSDCGNDCIEDYDDMKTEYQRIMNILQLESEKYNSSFDNCILGQDTVTKDCLKEENGNNLEASILKSNLRNWLYYLEEDVDCFTEDDNCRLNYKNDNQNKEFTIGNGTIKFLIETDDQYSLTIIDITGDVKIEYAYVSQYGELYSLYINTYNDGIVKSLQRKIYHIEEADAFFENPFEFDVECRSCSGVTQYYYSNLKEGKYISFSETNEYEAYTVFGYNNEGYHYNTSPDSESYRMYHFDNDTVDYAVQIMKTNNSEYKGFILNPLLLDNWTTCSSDVGWTSGVCTIDSGTLTDTNLIIITTKEMPIHIYESNFNDSAELITLAQTKYNVTVDEEFVQFDNYEKDTSRYFSKILGKDMDKMLEDSYDDAVDYFKDFTGKKLKDAIQK